jgi:hypothetical protein
MLAPIQRGDEPGGGSPLKRNRASPEGGDGEPRSIFLRSVFPGYFQTLGIHLLSGRDVVEEDLDVGPHVVILSQTAARRLFPGQDPLGKVVLLRQGLGLVAGGLVLGLAGAWAGTRLLGGMLFGVQAWDPATFLAVTGLVLGVGLAACSVPVWRAVRADPRVALQGE